MLQDHIVQSLRVHLGFEPTQSQMSLFPKLANYITNKSSNELFLIEGYAGTGKTSMINSLVCFFKENKAKFSLLAPTGRAAKVMTSYSSHPAFTIHKKIYRQRSSTDGFSEFALDVNLHTNTFFIVDEVSMISNESFENSIFGSGKLLDDLIKYVYNDKGCKLILVGDSAQLPPVGLEISPALDQKYLERYNLELHYGFLNDIVRQSLESGILSNSTIIRSALKVSTNTLDLDIKEFSDISYLMGNDVVEYISHEYDKEGMDNTIIVTRSNKRANQYNKGIRNQILWHEEEIVRGDLVMIVKNNYYWSEEIEELEFIANGDIAEIIRIIGYEERYGFRFADVELKLLDYNLPEFTCKIILDVLDYPGASLDRDMHKNFFYKVEEDYLDTKNKKKRYDQIRSDTYFNALQVKFAYAITCHKAQGGQWNTVFVDHGYMGEGGVDKEFLRWLYTAFTRASQRLYLVNFSKQLFLENSMDD